MAAARRLVRFLGPPALLLGVVVEYYFVAVHVGCRQGTIDCRPGGAPMIRALGWAGCLTAAWLGLMLVLLPAVD